MIEVGALACVLHASEIAPASTQETRADDADAASLAAQERLGFPATSNFRAIMRRRMRGATIVSHSPPRLATADTTV